MDFNPDVHRRPSIRLKGYDYSSPGACFITICTYQRECLLGNVEDGQLGLSELGQMVQAAWSSLLARFPSVGLDAAVVMPNHLHGILVVTKQRAWTSPAPTLGTVVGTFKSLITRECLARAKQENRRLQAGKLWHCNYFEHIIRDESEMNRIREYIHQNPARWAEDEYNTANV
ncbi:MAG: transposase [Nitrospinota bacterium]